ncbi:MAG: phosphate ABC transporter permease PstA [Dehalococcoidia bacterium]|nr:phosphate ABC transporter permease PstA [Dehalococcoidia bacterium]
MDRRRLEERVFKGLMITATILIVGSLFAVFFIVLLKGLPALSLSMITETPKAGYYLGGGGGILNAIVGSLYLAIGATIAALVIALPVALFLQKEYIGRSRFATVIRLSLDVLWGVPSIVYGAFGFIIMLYLGIKACLLGGIIALTLLELPIMIRAVDEVVRRVPQELKEASYALGATRLETTVRVVCRQILPGALTAVLLAFGRGIGDAASILFTAGYTDSLPHSLFDPVASLPLAVFFQIGTPFPEVQQRAYAAALVLLVVVLLLSIISRLLASKFNKYVVR